jgi:hypothetical protein
MGTHSTTRPSLRGEARSAGSADPRPTLWSVRGRAIARMGEACTLRRGRSEDRRSSRRPKRLLAQPITGPRCGTRSDVGGSKSAGATRRAAVQMASRTTGTLPQPSPS